MPEITARSESIKVFLEGVYIPCSYFRVNISMNAPAKCHIGVPLTNTLTDIAFEPPTFRGLQPGTMVQAFFKDSDEWKILFDGTIDTIGSQESFMTKVCELVGYDMSDHWATIPQYFLDKSKSGYPPGDYLLGRENATALKVRGQSVKIQDKFISLFRKHGLYVGTQKILEMIKNINPYYEGLDDRLKISNRFGIIENYAARMLFKKSKLWKELGKKLALLGGKKSIFEMLLTTLSVVRYVFAPNPIYSKLSNGNINSAIFTPNAFVKVPPRCNTVFPEEYNSIKPSGMSFRTIPTRLTSILENPFAGGRYKRPKVKIFVEPEAHSTALSKRDFTYFSDEEYYRGPVRVNYMIYSNLYAQSGTKSDEYSKQATKFDYYLQRYAHNTIQVAGGSIIPDLIVGFPILVLVYPKKHLLGRLINISIYIDATGELTTLLDIDCVRRYDAIEPPAFSSWFQDDLYANEFIGRSIYLDSLGFTAAQKDGSILAMEKTNRTNYKKAIENLCNGEFGVYDVHPNKEAFRRWWRNRNVLTLQQAMEFVGAQPKNYSSSRLTVKEQKNQFNNAVLFEKAGDYRAWYSDFISENPNVAKEGPYVSQRQEQMLLYRKSLADIVHFG